MNNWAVALLSAAITAVIIALVMYYFLSPQFKLMSELAEYKSYLAGAWVRQGRCSQSDANKEASCYVNAMVKRFGAQKTLDYANGLVHISGSQLVPLQQQCIKKCVNQPSPSS